MSPDQVDERDTELQQMVQSPLVGSVPLFVCDAFGLATKNLRAIADLIAAYNKANASNLTALLVAQALLRGHLAKGRGFTRLDAAPAPTACSLPRLLQFSELAEPLQKLVGSLDQFGRVAPSNAIASLYCHLAHWPSFLAMVHTALLPVHESGALKAEQGRVLAGGKELANTRLLPLATSRSLPSEENRSRAYTAMESFTEIMIARMLVMGTVMLELLPRQRNT